MKRLSTAARSAVVRPVGVCAASHFMNARARRYLEKPGHSAVKTSTIRRVGRALALCFAYATSSGIFSTSMLLCVIVMFNLGHKRPAVRLIRTISCSSSAMVPTRTVSWYDSTPAMK